MLGERGNSLLRLADRWLGIPLIPPAACFRKLSRPRFNHTRPTSIGLICPGAVGDLLLLSALVNGLHELWPDAKLEVIASAANSAALPLIPHLDNSFAAPVAKIGAILKYIRSRQYTVLIDASQWARYGALLAAFSGAKITVGFKTPGQYRSLSYDFKARHSNQQHELNNFLALGQTLWPKLTGKPQLKLPPWQPDSSNVVYCHMFPAPGPGRQLKEWPYWAKLIGELLNQGFAIHLTGGLADRPECEKFIAENFGETEKIKSLAGQISLLELGHKFTAAKAVISVNTGVMHLAALSGAPTIGLHGATNPLRWGPVGPRVLSLLPESGPSAYLNLGFEYPKGVKTAMPNLSVAKTLQALKKLNCL